MTDTVRRGQAMRFGAQLTESGVRFRLWAPGQARIALEIEEAGAPRAMRPLEDGWHELETEAAPGARYRFVLENGMRVPDPASRHQPEDVHGPSEVVDPHAYSWRDAAWRGRVWEEAVVYEAHVGAFTPDGSFRGAIDKLDHLAELGVTTLQLMPVADFAGTRNWGYDGVLPYAPAASYGRPEDMKALVDAAHARG